MIEVIRVIQNAAIALGNSGDAKAYDALTKLAAQESWHGRVRIAALNGLAALGDKRALESSYQDCRPTKLQTPQVRSTALNIVAATGKGDARAFPLIFERFKRRSRS